MIKTLLLIFIGFYIFGATGSLAYYLYMQWYTVRTAMEYDMEITNWEIESKGLVYIFCPLVNSVAAIALWLLIPNEKARIRYIIIMSTHPDVLDDNEDSS